MAKGHKTGGRVAGTPNRATAQRLTEIAASGETPLDYLLRIMRDETQPTPMRLDAAVKAAPYVHPKLNSVQHSGSMEEPVTEIRRIVVSWADRDYLGHVGSELP